METGKFIRKDKLSGTEELTAYIHKIHVTSHEVTLTYRRNTVF